MWMITTWFKHCRPVISIDAAHLYGRYKGKLLIAMAMDANNEVYPLVFAFVEKLKNLVWRAASANQVRKFKATLELICNVKPAAHRYLEAENKQKWTLAHDGGRRYRAMTTNLSKCFNGILKGARSLPITAMERFTFFKVNLYFDACRNLTLDQLEAGQEWCKYAMDKFKKNQAKAKDHIVTRMCRQAQLYHVDTSGNPLSNGGRQHMHRVDLHDMHMREMGSIQVSLYPHESAMRWTRMIGSYRAPYGLRMDQSQDIGCVAKRGTTIEHVLLEMQSQRAVELHHRLFNVISVVGLLLSTPYRSSSSIALDSSSSKVTSRAPNIDPQL
ncbi:hypothetical protein SO802_017680 [Lithocarpus litseifolius]|uniref:MULE transposase domain-containing protein n=1 Tax=Lithocarpus litseifolius TaxID=425828 RepID=A0AAW2CKL9_9ROSI